MEFEDLLKEIDGCLKNKFFYAALTLSLSIPDICAKIEFKDYNTKHSGEFYKKWYVKFIGKNENMFNQVYNCSDYSWIDEDIVYSMRCNIFHEGVPKVDKNKITKEINKADVFFVGVGDSSCLTKTDTKFVINDGELKPVKRCMISSAYLSRLLFEAGKKYYIDNKEKFNKDNSMCDYYSCDNLFMLMKKQN